MKQSEETRVHRMIEVEVGGGAEVQRCRGVTGNDRRYLKWDVMSIV